MRVLTWIRVAAAQILDLSRSLGNVASRASVPERASSSPHSSVVGRGPRRGETNENAPPLPGPLLHFVEEREFGGTVELRPR